MLICPAVRNGPAPLGIRPARLGIADGTDHGIDRVLEPVPVGRDDPGVTGDAQWGHGAGRVELIAPPEGLQDGHRLRAVGFECPLLRPAPGTFLDGRVQVDLEIRVREHDRADVSAGHDDPAA